MYTAKDFSHLLGLTGFSNALLNNHFTLYQGYVASTNKLIELLKEKRDQHDDMKSPEFAELHRRFGWEWNGMRLHELYFGNMTKGGVNLGERTLKQKIVSTWGTVENWQKEFIGMGAMRGIGWVILAHDKKDGKLFNVWINEHDVGHLAGATPLLVMDVFEHAFMLDYGLKRGDYITSFISSIDWHSVEERL